MATVVNTIDLKNYTSGCAEKQKIIVSRDKGHSNKHIAHNNSDRKVRHFLVDGGILPKGQDPDRCDYLLLVDDATPPIAYFIELKGSLGDAMKAKRQVTKTESMCKQSIKGYDVRYRIVFGRGHGNYGSDFIKWRDGEARGRVKTGRDQVEDSF